MDMDNIPSTKPSLYMIANGYNPIFVGGFVVAMCMLR